MQEMLQTMVCAHADINALSIQMAQDRAVCVARMHPNEQQVKTHPAFSTPLPPI